MNTTKLTVQKVTGLIKRSPVIFDSHKLPSSARNVRTPGVYATKFSRLTDEVILVGYDTWGSSHHIEQAQQELDKLIAFGEAEGYTFSKVSSFQYKVTK